MRVIIFLMLLIISSSASSQTFHALIFSNMKESAQRAADRTEEMNNMKSFCQKLVSALGYRQDIRTHSDIEFTSSQFLEDISSMDVGPDDVVVMFYNGHGCNWDDDDWPHLCFKDRQYWQTTAFEMLKERCNEAKLILCIGCCCNMDSRGRQGYSIDYDDSFEPNKTHALFANFNGKRRIITSSSIRGQYSYSWSSGPRLGSIYGISFREAINEILHPSSTVEPTWENILSLAKSKTINYTYSFKNGPQTPQFNIEDYKEKLSPRAQRVMNQMLGISYENSDSVKASVQSINLRQNVEVGGINSLVISVDFTIENMAKSGGGIVAFLDRQKGMGENDVNISECDVSVSEDFGTHKNFAVFNDFQLVIPMEQLHINGYSAPYYIRVGIYDYNTKKYITFAETKVTG